MSAPKSSTVPMGAAPLEHKRTSGMAIASLVIGIIGILIFGIILGPIAIILGALAKNEISKRPQELQGSGQATAGIVCGIIAIVVWVIVVAVYYG